MFNLKFLTSGGLLSENFCMKKGFRVSYNAPVAITFSFICTAVLLLDTFVAKGSLVPLLFTVPGCKASPSPFDWLNPLSYIRLFTHVLGHGDWNHLLGNLSFILLLGPLMEEKYGSAMIALMFTVTAFVTGIINACFIPSSLMGASGISFMLIILSSISTISKNQLPLSFILVLAVYVLREFITPSASNVSTIAHIAGGLCGSLFGFLVAPKQSRSQKITVSKNRKTEPKTEVRSTSQNRQTNRQEEDETVVGTIPL